MYEDLIKQLRYCANSELVCEETSSCPYYDKAEEKTHFYHCVERLIGQAADVIEELTDTAQAQDKALKECARQFAKQWIPVKDLKPKEREWVLCQCRANIREVLRLQNGKWYHDSEHSYMLGFVTHWMPLPKPPMENE